MNITLRKASENDFEEIISLIQEFAFFQRMPEKMTNSLEKMNEEKDYFTCFVAQNENNEIVGYASYFITYHTWSGKSLYMDDLYVKEFYRGSGVGKRLIESVIDFGRSENCQSVRWLVSSWNEPAIKFYRKLGASIDGTDLNCVLHLQQDEALKE